MNRPTPGASPILSVVRLAVLTFALVLLYAGLRKAFDIGPFQDVVQRHGVLESDLVSSIAWTAAILEVSVGALGVWCAIGRSSLRIGLGSASIATVFSAFAVYAGILTVHPPAQPAPCGCAGNYQVPVEDWSPILTRNALTASCLAVASIVIMASPRHALKRPPGGKPAGL